MPSQHAAAKTVKAGRRAKPASGSLPHGTTHVGKPAAWQLKLQQAIAHLRSQEPAQAEPLLRNLHQHWPDQPDVVHFFGVLRHQQGHSEEAISLLKQALALQPDNPDIWLNLGNMLLLGRDRSDEAVQAYRRSVALMEPPQRAGPALSNLCVVLRKQGLLAEAVAAGQRAVELVPDFADAWYNLSEAYLASGEVPEGLRAQSQAMLLLPATNFRRQQIIRALLLLGLKERAVQQLQQWLDEEPDNPVVKHQLLACLGKEAPARASDAYVQKVFDSFSASFDIQLERLQYKAPELVTQALQTAAGAPAAALDIIDAGCGTGLCGPLLKPWARSLVGCDLSIGMLQRAVPRAVYDRLVHVELVQFLASVPASCDAVVSADTLCYFGPLEAVAQAAAAALRPGGWLIFTAEALPADTAASHLLQPNGRYAHADGYLKQTVLAADLQLSALEPVMLRMEAGRPVNGWLVVAGKP